MRGAVSLQRQLTTLAARYGVLLSSPRRVPKTPPPDHETLILEGVASTSEIDVDRVSFAPFCFGASLPTVPLLVEHDAARRCGTATLTYDTAGGLRVRTSPLTGEARCYGAFSIAVRNIQYDLHAAELKSFHAIITSADLTEISLTEYPHLPTALITNRMRPSANAAFYGAAQEFFIKAAEIVTLLQKQGAQHGSASSR